MENKDSIASTSSGRVTESLRSAEKPNAWMRNVRVSLPNLKLQGVRIPKLPQITPPHTAAFFPLLAAIFDKPKIHLKQLHLSIIN